MNVLFVVLVFLTVMHSGVIALANTSLASEVCPNVRTSLSMVRKRRHLAFPEGSNILLTISLVKAFMTHAPAGWNIALEIDVLYPLPDEKFLNRHYRRKLHHKQKREFWKRIQDVLDYHSINGKSCIFRSICEAREFLAPAGQSLVHDILRAIFTAPLHEKEFREEIKDSYNEILEPDLCEGYNDCPLSIFGFILSLDKQRY